MPMKWTPDNDQILLLKILETHNLHVDAKKISTAWPKDRETPTPRAITERLVKIRQAAKSNGADHFGIASAQAQTPRSARPPKDKVSTPASTPRKGRTSTGASVDTPNSGKRKRGSTVQVKEEPDGDNETITANELAQLGIKTNTNSPNKSFRSTTSHGVNLSDPTGGSPAMVNGTSASNGPFGYEDEPESPTKRVRSARNRTNIQSYMDNTLDGVNGTASLDDTDHSDFVDLEDEDVI